MIKIILIKSLLLVLILFSNCSSGSTPSNESDTIIQETTDDAQLFLSLFHSTDRGEINNTIKKIDSEWKTGYIPMVIETVYLSKDSKISFDLISILQKKTGKKFGYDFNAWFYWLWNQPEHKLENYATFKAGVYKILDERFEGYFKGRNQQSTIRLDEVRWGGVSQDGIPPLRQPNMVSADEAHYLKDNNVIFGIEVNGDFRAYPKRILAWHEMFVDEVGGLPVAGVYCTLCGTVVLYKTEFQGVHHQLGTSGFLYRSNKLMYDKATQSLWNTLQGEPVIGPLVGKGIVLEHLSVVTTTWGEWKQRHPNTLVLSLETGHQRDYGEGVAYRNYFSDDELMFNTPFNDNRLRNKDEVLAIRLPQQPNEQLAVSAKFLKKNFLYQDKIGNQNFVVLTDKSGANRVYNSNKISFVSYDQENSVADSAGKKWKLEESKLVSEDGIELNSLPYHRAFWFGWYAAFPNTRLIK